MKKLSIAEDFSEFPGARYKADGKFSGEEFLENHLRPLFLDCQEREEKLLIDFDGTNGFATSFLDEAFGQLSKEFRPNHLLNILQFKSDDEPDLIEDVTKYINNAHEK